ncbi:alginate lyase family protein [Mucilaginibacter sabulilitoris]|uniref:Alginate lyase family protein n=1 Tax=Mucilaginibacter sabulilitoris TaxID=1173583 RepID=A0ABZ0TNK5_9SPHI|nr:alginate lyase family protein [Mucilaginibacter sabulilitoris]WPU94740.1 alginate lyase family protein [Mucilaginibacter sabulilitoris]
MKLIVKILQITVIITLTAFGTNLVFAQNKFLKSFQHPGMMQSKTDLETMKANINAGKQPWKAAFEKLKAATPLDYKTKAVAHLSQGAYGTDDRGGKELLRSAGIAYDAALLWYITGDKRYANESVAILNAWSAKLWDFDGNNAKLLAGLSGHYLLNAAEVIRYSNADWKPLEVDQFKRFMLSVYYPLIKDFFPEANGNWDASMINTMLCIGIFCDNHEIFDRAVSKYIYGNGNGGIVKYIYPGGQIQEATRDWGHVQLGLGEFAKAAQTAWTQGVDLFSIAGNRLALGFEYASKFLLNEDVPVYGVISGRERGGLRDIYETIYNFYHFQKNLDMPYTRRIVERTRTESTSALLVSLRNDLIEPGTLTRLPEPGMGALLAGATTDTGKSYPSNAVLIRPGESIQAALDHCSDGATIVLLKGVHTLASPLQLPSNVSIIGSGRQSILFLSPNLKDAAIINRSPDMHNVSLTNFLIEGGLNVTESEDPNNNRRLRSYQHAAPRAGILFRGQSDSIMNNIRLVQLTVQNCTQNGVYIAGANKVDIQSCDLSDNGSSVAPGPGLQHNLYLKHVTNVKVGLCRLDTSPFGNGLQLSESSHAEIWGNETARNKKNGIYISGTSDLLIRQNQMEGNDANGLLAENARGLTVNKNTSRNNGEKGLSLVKTSANSPGNIIVDNGK